MAKTKPKGSRRILRKIGIAFGVLVVFLLLFVAAFVFNPFEGSLPEMRDAVPRDVNFFLRKERLAYDFDPFPTPRFWSEVSETKGFTQLAAGKLGQSWKRAGLDRALQRATESLAQVRTDSGGWLDVMRDLLGSEVILAGFEQDYAQQPPKPLAEPQWCLYARVSWRVKALLGLAGFSLVQSRLKEQGLDVTSDGADLVVKLPGASQPLRLRRHLDMLMVSNHKPLIEQSQRLLDGSRDEESIGRKPAYTDGALKRIDKWATVNAQSPPNVAEFVIEPNAYDAFRRFAAEWPNPQNKDSMNERVLARFLNLKGWMQITGGLMFTDGAIAATGEIGLNSKQHTPFQQSFYKAEEEPREKWLDPFLRMVPESACAAAALRMPAGEFLHEMFDALDDKEKELVNDMVKRATFQGQNLVDVNDLIERLKPALLPRTGFVFRQNDPITERDTNGELKIPVATRSPMPQVAWVFWLRPNGQAIVESFAEMLRTYYSTFRFKKQWYLPVPTADGQLPERVSEFTSPQIPATGEIALIVFREFFVISNSGPLIQDILRTRHTKRTGMHSLLHMPEFATIDNELPPNEVNAFVWMHGENLIPMFDDYLAFTEANSELADAEWMRDNRPAAEDQVRRTQFPRFPSVASMPKSMTDPGGEFDVAVVAYLRDLWRKERTSFTADDRQQIEQLKAMAQMLKVAYLQLELKPNFIRYQARLMSSSKR